MRLNQHVGSRLPKRRAPRMLVKGTSHATSEKSTKIIEDYQKRYANPPGAKWQTIMSEGKFGFETLALKHNLFSGTTTVMTNYCSLST
jgi:hypothetical protein